MLQALPAGMRALVIDHESSDGTAQLARSLGARTIVRPFGGFVDARRFALAQVDTPWTFMIDADERPDARLQQAILAAPDDADGYTVARTTFYCGKPLRMWSNERLLRLFRTDRVRLHAAPAAGGAAQLHERWTCAGTVRDLSGTLEHFSYPDEASYREKFARYTDIEAQGAHRSAAVLFHHALLVPVRLASALVRRGALLDGPPGWRVAWYSALYPAVVAWKALRS